VAFFQPGALFVVL